MHLLIGTNLQTSYTLGRFNTLCCPSESYSTIHRLTSCSCTWEFLHKLRPESMHAYMKAITIVSYEISQEICKGLNHMSLATQKKSLIITITGSINNSYGIVFPRQMSSGYLEKGFQKTILPVKCSCLLNFVFWQNLTNQSMRTVSLGHMALMPKSCVIKSCKPIFYCCLQCPSYLFALTIFPIACAMPSGMCFAPTGQLWNDMQANTLYLEFASFANLPSPFLLIYS